MERSVVLIAALRGCSWTKASSGNTWRWRISSWPHDRHALHEASYHLLRAGEAGQRPVTRHGTVRRLTVLGSAAVAVTVAACVTAAATGAFSASAKQPGPSAAHGSAAADPLAGRSAAVRDRAAAWVTGR